MENNIVLIEVEKIHNHPDNPRQNIGDVTELAESIKASGILQNLTIVPATGHYHGEYFALIGHRRLAAARLAGLDAVPCVINDVMDRKEQIKIMLTENMQRSDLTVYEEAQGFQMMLDMGDTIADVSESTGFSESTIRRRVKLLDLDGEKFKQSTERQVSLSEYDRLFEIEDEKTRDKLLDSIGTSNFNNEFSRAKQAEASEKRKEQIRQKLDMFAIKIKEEDKKDKVYYRWCSDLEGAIPSDESDVRHYYIETKWGGFGLYRDKTEAERNTDKEVLAFKEEQQKKADANKERQEQLAALAGRFYQLRYDFIKGFSDFKKKTAIICAFACWALTEKYGDVPHEDDFLAFTGVNLLDDDEDFSEEKYREFYKEKPIETLLYASYLNMDYKTRKYSDWSGEHRKNEELDMIYEYLVNLGYEMSDEEKAWQDGTHELFKVID